MNDSKIFHSPNTTYPLKEMNLETLMTMPFMEALALIVKGAVDEYLDRNGLLSAIAEAAKGEKKNDSNSLDSEGALAFLKENGYPMKKGQLYKMTSDPESGLPFYKFGNKLHFKKDELLAWAESKLVSGNAVGYLSPADTTKKGGCR